MRVERDDRRLGPGLEQRLDHAPVAQVHAVERPERDRPRPPLELPGRRATFIGERRQGLARAG